MQPVTNESNVHYRYCLQHWKCFQISKSKIGLGSKTLEMFLILKSGRSTLTKIFCIAFGYIVSKFVENLFVIESLNFTFLFCISKNLLRQHVLLKWVDLKIDTHEGFSNEKYFNSKYQFPLLCDRTNFLHFPV